MELKINIIAVLVAVVLNFFLGFIWYTPLFGKAWGKEMGYDPNMKPDKSLMMKGILFMIIGNFLFAWVFAYNIAAWNFVPGANEMNTLTKGLHAAVFTWSDSISPANWAEQSGRNIHGNSFASIQDISWYHYWL